MLGPAVEHDGVEGEYQGIKGFLGENDPLVFQRQLLKSPLLFRCMLGKT